MSPTSSPSSNRFSVLAEQDIRLDMDDAPTQPQQDSARGALGPASRPSEELPEGTESSQPAGKELSGTQLDTDVNMRDQEGILLSEAQVIDTTPVTTRDSSVGAEMQSKPNEPGDPLPEESAEMPKLSRPKPWDGSDNYVFMPRPKLDDPWETIKQGLDKYDKEMCDAWNDELNTILTFTGLFSAAVTAFCIESFQNLSQNPADTTNTFLMIISQQLANSSSPVAGLSMVDAFVPQASDIQINVLYFLSLTLALSASSVCILAKQWIREYQKDISVSPCDAARIRQARFDSLEAWKVPQIIGALPVILLGALMMFFSGLLIQLWNVGNQATAQIVTVIAALTVVLVVATTVIPALVGAKRRLSCFTPFRSPQAWIFFYAYRRLQHWFHPRSDLHLIVSSWADYDLNFLKREWVYENDITSVHRVLHWAMKVLRNSSEIEKALLMCLQPKYHPHDLIDSITRLGDYVLSNEGSTEDLHVMYYNYHKKSLGRQRHLSSVVERHLIELLIRFASEAIVARRWDMIQRSCQCLRYEHLESFFASYTDNTIINCTCEPLNRPFTLHLTTAIPLNSSLIHPHSDQHILQDQLALLLEKIFTLPLLLHSVDWDGIIDLLLYPYSSPLSRQITLDMATIQIPAWIRKHSSVSLLYDIGRAIMWNSIWSPSAPRIGRPLFTHLDKMMVEWCSRPEGMWGLDEKRVKQWRKLRSEYVKYSRLEWWLPEHLPDDHFDNLPGHGPLILAAAPSPEL